MIRRVFVWLFGQSDDAVMFAGIDDFARFRSVLGSLVER